MKSTEILHIDPYFKYLDFIKECKKKAYGDELVLHLHHVLPKHLKTGIPDRQNTVHLSVDDHVTAHLMLAECFTEGSYERLANIKSAKLLSKNSIKNKKLLEELYKYISGEGNPFYGKNHTESTLKILSESTIKSRTGIDYEQFYGDKSQIEKDKRSIGTKKVWENRTKEEKEALVSKIKKSKEGTDISGSNNPNAKVLYVDGIKYGSVAEAKKLLNKSRYKLFKEHKITY